MSLPPIFVISLTRSTDRRDHIVKEFARQNIPFKFFDAFDGNKIKVSSSNPYLYDHSDWASRGQGDRPDFFVGPGINALSLSHQALMKYLIMMDIPEAIICEDDVTLVDGFEEKFTKLRSGLPADYSLLFLEYCCEHTMHCVNEQAGLWRAHSLCTASYLVSQAGAREIENIAVLGEPYDCLLYHFAMPIDGHLVAKPKLAGQKSIDGGFPTTLS